MKTLDFGLDKEKTFAYIIAKTAVQSCIEENQLALVLPD